MGILTSILNSANALKVYDQEFATIQNNIANANTPGFADQNVTLSADSFNPSEGLDGGVTAGPLASSRSQYLEQSVRAQTTKFASRLACVAALILRSISGRSTTDFPSR